MCLVLGLHSACYLDDCFLDGCFLCGCFLDGSDWRQILKLVILLTLICLTLFTLTNFGQVTVILLSLGKTLVCKLYKVKTVLIKSCNKIPLGETGCNFPGYFSLPATLHHDYFQLSTFLNYPGVQFFDSPLSQYSQLGYFWLFTPHCAAPV